MAKLMSTLISNLEKSIKTLQVMELNTIIKVLKSTNIELRSFVLALQIHIPTFPLLFSDLLMLQELPFHIWGIIINLTKEFSENHDSVINDLAQVVMDLDELAKQTIVFRPIKISKRKIKPVSEIVDAVFANPVSEIKYEEVSKTSNDSSHISTHAAPLSEHFIHATTLIPTRSSSQDALIAASKDVHIATSCVRPGCFNGHPVADYISCLTLLNGYCKEGKMIDAYKILVEMIESGYKPDGFLIHPNDLEVPNIFLMTNNVKSECIFVSNKSLKYKDAKTSYVATEIQNMAVMKKLHLLIINGRELMENFEVWCAGPAIDPTWPSEQEFADAQVMFVEINKRKCESKILIFDPGGTFIVDGIFDLEDKVDFKGMVMIGHIYSQLSITIFYMYKAYGAGDKMLTNFCYEK